MQDAECVAIYARTLREIVTVRRRTGQGPIGGLPVTDAAARARVVAYRDGEFVGTVSEGDRKAIVLAADIDAHGLTLPLTTADKIVFAGKEFAIVSVVERKALSGTLIAYELQIRG
jgi:hypothetical protein